MCVNFLYSVTLNSTASSYRLKESFMHDFVMPCVGDLDNIGSLSYAALPNADMVHYTMVKSCIH